MKRRIRLAGIFCTVLLVALGIRLFYLQVVCREELRFAAQEQHLICIQSRGARGTIYDRNMQKLTNEELRYCYLVPCSSCNGELEKLMKEIGGRSIGFKGKDYLVYETKRFDKEINHRLVREKKAYGFCISKRYGENQTAAHLIGYLNGEKEKGVYGLEKVCQNKLSATPVILSLEGDGQGAPIRGRGIEEYQESGKIHPASVITTIDKQLQQETERIMEKQGVQGAAVILDTATGEVRAMASTPTFAPGRIGEYMDSEKGELINKAIQGVYPPGSVFKIVVAAAALESGKLTPESVFSCGGRVRVQGVEMTCSEHREGHGEVDMKEAFAQSCNCYFAQAAEEIGGKTILSMAEKMGLHRKALSGFSEEEKGSLPPEEEYLSGGLANLAVGQGSLLVTPLQVARMTNIIANGGIDKRIKVLCPEGEEREMRKVLSKKTAGEIGEMMEEVMVSGTGKGSRSHSKVAGKTGSAEASADGTVVHGWFTGFFPSEAPRYTVTVFAENGKTGSGSALPVFDEIVNYLY